MSIKTGVVRFFDELFCRTSMNNWLFSNDNCCIKLSRIKLDTEL